jgi:hypothetical protein
MEDITEGAIARGAIIIITIEMKEAILTIIGFLLGVHQEESKVFHELLFRGPGSDNDEKRGSSLSRRNPDYEGKHHLERKVYDFKVLI